MKRIGLLGGVLVGEGLVLATLMALPAAIEIPGPTEILSATPARAIYGTIWLVAMTLTSWMMATTIASVAARLTRLRSVVRAVDWCTLPAIRRMAERVTALSLVASSLATPALASTGVASASEAPPVPVVVVAEPTTATVAPDLTPVPVPRVAPISDPLPVFDSPVGRSTRAIALDDGPTRYVVRPGDNMWSITASYLEEQLGARPSDARVSETWRIVMDLNRAGIRSGNVDLIFPGEELVLPPISS